MKKTEFIALELPKKGVAPSTNRYRVYKDAKDFSVVEAKSALEALQASGLQKAHRIERDSILANNLIDLKLIGAETPKAEEAKPAEAATAPAEAATAAPATPAGEEVKPGETDKQLSGEQVDKLLKGDAPKAVS